MSTSDNTNIHSTDALDRFNEWCEALPECDLAELADMVVFNVEELNDDETTNILG